LRSRKSTKVSYKTWLEKVVMLWLQTATILDLKAAMPIPEALALINAAFKKPEGTAIAKRMLAEAERSVERQQLLREVRGMSRKEYKAALRTRKFRNRLRAAGI
jgi:hypothetical protein